MEALDKDGVRGLFQYINARGEINKRLFFPAGKAIHLPEERADHLYLIESGEVRIYDDRSKEHSRLLRIAGPRDWIGAATLARMPVFESRAVAVRASICWRIPDTEIRQIFAHRSDLAMYFLQTTAEQLINARREASQLVFDDCWGRLISTLLSMGKSAAAQPGDNGVILRITHAQLAQAIGVARETVSVCLTELRQKNIVKTGRNQLVFNPEALESFRASHAAAASAHVPASTANPAEANA